MVTSKEKLLDIGKKLQEIRTSNGLSQRELASRAGLTNGTISLIEQNKTSPSVASLKSLLDAIPMSLGEFFGTIEDENTPRYFYAADEFTEIAPPAGETGVSLRQLGNASQHALQILDETYPPNADTGPELLRHPGEEAGIVTSGQIEVTVGETVRVLSVGDGYLFDSQLPHRFRNIGQDTCTIISACTPPTF